MEEGHELGQVVTVADEHAHYHYPPEESHGVFYESDKLLRREPRLYRDRELHNEPLEHSARDYEYEEIREEHYHPHLKDILVVDDDAPLGQEDYSFSQLPSEPVAEPIEPRPMERLRRLTDSEDEILLYRTPEMDEIFFNEVWDIYNKRRLQQSNRLSEIQEETLSFGPESGSSSKPSSETKNEIHHELPQIIEYEKYGKPPVHVGGDSSDSQVMSPEIDVGHLDYGQGIEEVPLDAVVKSEEVSYDAVPHEKESDYSEHPVPAPRVYEGFSSFSESDNEELRPEHELPKSEFYIEQEAVTAIAEQARSAIYDRPYEAEPIYSEITHIPADKPPRLPETLPPTRHQPIEYLERDPEFAREAFDIVETVFKTITEHKHPHITDSPNEPPTRSSLQPLPKDEPQKVVVVHKEPAYKFPNVREMTQEYAEKHERLPTKIVPAPRLQRLYPTNEIQQIKFEPTRPVAFERHEPQKIVHRRLPEHVVAHPTSRRRTLEYETASDLEYSPIPVRATERFREFDVSPFVQEPVTESQLSTPVSSEVGSRRSLGQEKPRPIERIEIVPTHQPQKLRPIEKPQKLRPVQRYRPGTGLLRFSGTLLIFFVSSGSNLQTSHPGNYPHTWR